MSLLNATTEIPVAYFVQSTSEIVERGGAIITSLLLLTFSTYMLIKNIREFIEIQKLRKELKRLSKEREGHL